MHQLSVHGVFSFSLQIGYNQVICKFLLKYETWKLLLFITSMLKNKSFIHSFITEKSVFTFIIYHRYAQK